MWPKSGLWLPPSDPARLGIVGAPQTPAVALKSARSGIASPPFGATAGGNRLCDMSQSVEPYQAMAVVGDSATCAGGQCQFTFPTVPAGKRLLITSVSAQLGQNNTIVLEGNGVSYFVTKTHPDLGDVTAPVSLYYEPGSTPTARVFAPDTTQHTSLIITLVGELNAV
jgi:hypothetical protein